MTAARTGVHAQWQQRQKRLGYRNGYRLRTLTTQAGDIELQIP